MFGSILVRVVAGACAGAAATFLMDRVTTFVYGRTGKQVKQEEIQARGGLTAQEYLGDTVTTLAGRHDVPTERLARIGTIVRYATGATCGVIYALARSLGGRVSPLRALGLGLTVFALVDELGYSLIGLPPNRFPWQSHARGLVGNVVFGAATEGVLSGVGAPLERVGVVT